MKEYLNSIEGKIVTLESNPLTPEKITEETLVTLVFTDFKKNNPIYISFEKTTADDAFKIMKTKHVRCLFIVNANKQVLGIITSRILCDHYLIEYMATHDIHSRSDVLASDIMIKLNDINTIDYDVLKQKKFTIKDTVKFFCDLHERHLFVTKSIIENEVKIRGIISAADIARKMNINFDPNLETLTFSNLLKYMSI